MLIAFMDESYTPERYFIAAFAMDESDLAALYDARDRTRELIASVGIDRTTELHAHSLMAARDGWNRLDEQVRVRLHIYRTWLEELARLPATVIVRASPGLRRTPTSHPHTVTMELVLRDIDVWARELDDTVRVVADSFPGQTARLAELVDGAVLPTLRHLRLPVVFRDSSTHPGLEAADGVAYLVRRHFAHQETNPRVARAVTNLWNTVSPLVRNTSTLSHQTQNDEEQHTGETSTNEMGTDDGGTKGRCTKAPLEAGRPADNDRRGGSS